MIDTVSFILGILATLAVVLLGCELHLRAERARRIRLARLRQTKAPAWPDVVGSDV